MADYLGRLSSYVDFGFRYYLTGFLFLVDCLFLTYYPNEAEELLLTFFWVLKFGILESVPIGVTTQLVLLHLLAVCDKIFWIGGNAALKLRTITWWTNLNTSFFIISTGLHCYFKYWLYMEESVYAPSVIGMQLASVCLLNGAKWWFELRLRQMEHLD